MFLDNTLYNFKIKAMVPFTLQHWMVIAALASGICCQSCSGDEPAQSVNVQELADTGNKSSKLNEQAVQLLRSKCISCHGSETAEGNLRLDSHQSMLNGGDRGILVGENNYRESLLWQSVAGLRDDLQMPPKNPLAPSELAILEKWLQSGVHWPEFEMDLSTAKLSSNEILGDAWTDDRNPIARIFGGERLQLWSLKPIQKPTLPELSSRNANWSRGDLDRWPLARFESAGVDPPSMANRHTLVRRLHFDLTGLPPTTPISNLESVEAGATREFEELVDRLLNSEQFGQHWARMWLDVARYSDSNGFDWDEFRPQAWRYRDYVIRSLNADKPLDQFIREQLAGDELFDGPPQDQAQQDALIATGFLRLGPHDNAAKLFNEQDRSRDELLTDLVETTGSALLGITLSCCRCHDHKHDPFSQADHFRLRACFAGVKFADDLPINLANEQQQITQHNLKIDEQIALVEADKRKLLEAIAERMRKEETVTTSETSLSEGIDADTDAANKTESDEEPSKKVDSKKKRRSKPSEKQLLEAATEPERQSIQQFKDRIAEAQKQKQSFAHALMMLESIEEIPSTFVLYQGDHKSPRELVNPGILSALDPNPLRPAQAVREKSSGRRLALAQWIASPENPLTARVFVNRVWQNLMGRGLVTTPGDFGLAGAMPEEPQLLDWLAYRFVEEGWSLKKLVRTIVLSSTYQQAAMYSEPNASVAHLLRYPRRLTAEQLRDSMLAVSGLLTSKNSGPPEWPELPNDVLEANPAFLDDNETKTKGWYPSPVEQQYCRSIFLVQKRNTRVPLLEIFDQPENSVSCTKRFSSVVAPQALSLLNGAEAVAAARAFADRIAAQTGEKEDLERIRFAFQLALQRDPSDGELQACQQLLTEANSTELCRVLLNLNEFAYID